MRQGGGVGRRSRTEQDSWRRELSLALKYDVLVFGPRPGTLFTVMFPIIGICYLPMASQRFKEHVLLSKS